MKSIKLFSVILVLSLLMGCVQSENQENTSSVHEVAVKENYLSYTDFLGKERTMQEEIELLHRFVYARRTTGLFVDNLTSPQLFNEEGYVGDQTAVEEDSMWKTYLSSTNNDYENFTVDSAMCAVKVYKDGSAEPPSEQWLELSDVKLKGILRLVTEFDGSPNSYALNYNVGDIYFYPYPENMGEFPMLFDGTYSPLLIRGEKVPYKAWTDTQRIKITDLTEEQILNIFDYSDLAEVEIIFSELKFMYSSDFPNYSETTTDTICKLKDL